MSDKTKRFLDLMTSVTTRPGMYRINNVEELYLFISGYRYGMYNTDEKDPVNNLLDDFSIHMNNYFDLTSDDNRYPWDKLIKFYSGNDRHSLELFSTCFNEFLAQYK